MSLQLKEQNYDQIRTNHRRHHICIFLGKPDRWKVFFSLGAVLLVLSRLTLIFQHKSDPSAALESLMKLSGPIMAVGGFLIGFANVLVFKHFKSINKSENNS